MDLLREKLAEKLGAMTASPAAAARW